MSVKHLDHLNLSVENLEESLGWYARLFGFERVEGGVVDGVPWAIVRAGEALICLYEHPGREMLDRPTLEKRRIHGLSHYGLRITDPAAFQEAAAGEGVEIRYLRRRGTTKYDPRTEPARSERRGVVNWPHSKAWYVLDPTGYEIKVVHWDGDTVKF